MHLIKLLIIILCGLAIAYTTGSHNPSSTAWYAPTVALLLAVGLYASTYGIDIKEAKQHAKIIISAVTIGVVLKAAIIGVSLSLLFNDPFFLILGVAVAQIDPLSVANLLKGNRMSKKAKTILASWASFDDPITVLLSLYVPLVVVHLTSLNLSAIDSSASANFMAYVASVGLNVVLAGSALLLWLIIRRYAKTASGRLASALTVCVYLLLAAVFSVSVLHFMMLGIALIGLFLRPPKVAAFIDTAVTGALYGAALLLGFVLVKDIDIKRGLALGTAAYFSQVVVGFLLTRSLPAKDRWHISFAQQNGITAIILSLLFEPVHPGTVAIVAPAIITINCLHWLMNKLVDQKFQSSHH